MPVASFASWGFPIERILENFPNSGKDSGVLFVPLGKGETFKQREYSSQLSIPLCFTGKVRGSRRMDLSPCSENTSVFTLPVPLLQNAHVFPIASKLSTSCAISTGRCKEWGRGRGKCFTTRPGTSMCSVFFNSSKKVTPCRRVLLPMIVQRCGMLIHIGLIRKLGVYLVAEIERRGFFLVKLICHCLVFMNHLVPY